MNVPITFFPSYREILDKPLIVRVEVEGYLVGRVHVDEGRPKNCVRVFRDVVWMRWDDVTMGILDDRSIYPNLPNQEFVDPPSEDELILFIKELGYSGTCEMLSVIRTDQMHQPWRTFAAIINSCISGKSTGLDRLRESRAQILWAMYNQKNVDYVALLWEDFMYQADNR
ncbi:hypothetical protein Tco_0874551 [Tanacetum coccineum]|uniref:Uncharacterized protein n=1 Tax=Tanacetum coccineum TaxID=301880 RepID=A0ABQ5BLY7_9ASTR